MHVSSCRQLKSARGVLQKQTAQLEAVPEYIWPHLIYLSQFLLQVPGLDNESGAMSQERTVWGSLH